MIKSLCIFCGSSSGIRHEYAEYARKLANLLVDHDIQLVYGGANVGLMGEIANAMLHRKGKIVGVMTQYLVDKEIAHPELSDLKIVNSMHERKQKMSELADAFIILPGGLGSLDEFFEVWTWAQLGLQRKACGILNVRNYFDSLLDFLDHAVNEGFLKQIHREMVLVENDPEIMLHKLINLTIPIVDKWIYNVESA